jgi:hypothetical protein
MPGIHARSIVIPGFFTLNRVLRTFLSESAAQVAGRIKKRTMLTKLVPAGAFSVYNDAHGTQYDDDNP